MRYTDKVLIVELLEFMRSRNKKSIILKDYIKITERRFHWTKQRKEALYKVIHSTKALFIDYVPVIDPEHENVMILCVRVKRTEVK